MGGVLFVWWNGQIAPSTIGLGATIDVLVIAVIGGLYRLEGAWLGALVFVLINNYAQQIGFIGGRSTRSSASSSWSSCCCPPTASSACGRRVWAPCADAGAEAPATEERGSAEQLTPVQ